MKHGVIEVRLQEISKLFDTMDPSPLCEKDLHPNVAEHIVDSAKELSYRTALTLVLHVDQTPGSIQDTATVSEAIRAYFTHEAQQARRRLRLHLRRGLISLIIGLSFLAGTLTLARLLGSGPVASTLRESLDIGGWVAMWRPMEMFLYDWWPLLGEQLRYRRLGKMDVQIKYTTPRQPTQPESSSAQSSAGTASTANL